ncbi:MAG TPA: TraI domain-containing protein [Planctomycetota bacterium]|nr:TraI domain-containing protein [Planctomycetota bacterium]
MFERFWRKGVGGDAAPSFREPFGALELEAGLAQEAIEAAGGEGCAGAVRDALRSLSPVEKDDLVDRLVLRLALMVMDLQGSQSHHHNRPYGLLEHLLSVARAVVSRLGPALQVTADRAVPERERDLWVYGGFLMGLLHDLGKVLDLDVQRPDGGDRWNPLGEPLAAFCARNGIRTTGPDWWQYRRGRGLTGHVWHGIPLFSLLLPRPVTDVLGPRLFLLTDAMILHGMSERLSHVPPHAMQIARVVAEVDVELSREDLRRPGPGGSREARDSAGGTLERELSAVLEEGLRHQLLPLNRPGGVYVTPTALLLEYPESFDLAGGLLPSELASGIETGGATPDLSRFREGLLGRLVDAQLLPLHVRSGRTVELGILSHPDGRSREGALVVLSRPLLPPELPLFGGTIRLEGPDSLWGYGPGDDETGRAGPPGAAGRRLKAPRRVPSGPRHSSEEVRSDPRLYAQRVDLELHPDTLAEDLDHAVSEGLLSRNCITGEVFHREGCLWFRLPTSLTRIFRRKGIALSSAQLETALEALRPLWGVDAQGVRPTSVQVRVHPDRRDAERVLCLPADLIVVPQDLRDSIGEWPHPIEVLSTTVGEQSRGDHARETPGPRPRAGQGDRRSPDDLPLARFTQIYQAVWDLCTNQTIVRTELEDLANEFEQKVRRTRLILYRKRSGRPSEVYALFWGRSLSALRGEEDSPGWKGPKRIHYLSGPVTDDWIEAWGLRHRRATYFDFDRRRLALNEAFGAVTLALTTTLQLLRHRYTPALKSAGLPPLPPSRLLQDLSPQGLRGVRLGWALARAEARGHDALTAHVAAGATSQAASPGVVVQRAVPPISARSAFRVRPEGVEVRRRMTKRQLRMLKIPDSLHPGILAAEKERLRLRSDLEEHEARVRRILVLSADAIHRAARLLSEAGTVLVDQDDQPIGLPRSRGGGPRA